MDEMKEKIKDNREEMKDNRDEIKEKREELKNELHLKMQVRFTAMVERLSKLGPVKVRAFDSGQAMTFLVPLLSLYFGRRFTDSKAEKSSGS